jgi:sugar-phosphatase
MTPGCQTPEPFAIAVGGVAGSGKSTLGRALAASLRAPLLDLDTLTNPLLDALGDDVFGSHWLSSVHAPTVRRGRYAALLATAADVLSTTGRVVLVAPFTAELAGGPAWDDLVGAVPPGSLRMVQIVGRPEVFARRRAARGTERDQYRTPGPEASGASSAVPVTAVDAELSTAGQLAQLLADLGAEVATDLG